MFAKKTEVQMSLDTDAQYYWIAHVNLFHEGKETQNHIAGKFWYFSAKQTNHFMLHMVRHEPCPITIGWPDFFHQQYFANQQTFQ